MAGKRTEETKGYIFWDTVGAGANPIAPFQCVSLADQTEVDAAIAAGVRGDAKVGRVVVPCPTGTVLGATVNTRRIVGVTCNAAFSGEEVLVQDSGIAEVMVNAAVAADALLFAVARATRTSLQTPLTSLEEMLLPHDPRFTLTYQLCMADDPALTLSAGGSNAFFWPLGHALVAAAAQYEVIPVQLQLGVLVG